MTTEEFLGEVLAGLIAVNTGEITVDQYAVRLAIITLVAEGNADPTPEQVHTRAAEFRALAGLHDDTANTASPCHHVTRHRRVFGEAR